MPTTIQTSCFRDFVRPTNDLLPTERNFGGSSTSGSPKEPLRHPPWPRSPSLASSKCRSRSQLRSGCRPVMPCAGTATANTSTACKSFARTYLRVRGYATGVSMPIGRAMCWSLAIKESVHAPLMQGTAHRYRVSSGRSPRSIPTDSATAWSTTFVAASVAHSGRSSVTTVTTTQRFAGRRPEPG